MNTHFDPNDPDPARRQTGPAGTPAEQPLSATEARQGREGFPVLKVLIAGLVLALIAWGVAEMWGQSTEPPAEQTATPPAADTVSPGRDAQPSADPAQAPTAAGAPAD